MQRFMKQHFYHVRESKVDKGLLITYENYKTNTKTFIQSKVDKGMVRESPMEQKK